MTEKYVRWNSRYLNREMEMLVFGKGGYPFILFPTSKGRYFQNKEFGLIGSVAELIDSGKVKIYCPDSMDEMSWYNYDIHPADRVKTHMAYENVIMADVVELATKETGYSRVGMGGCSFGAYHAANTAFRHPDKIAYVITMGGAFDIKQFVYGYYDDNCYFNNPPDYLQGLRDPRYIEKMKDMGIILGTGAHDSCLGDNKRLANILDGIGVSNWLDVRPNAGHDWPWWKAMFPYYLSQVQEIGGQ
jgi:esterase/lipase superfamily enzyme